ncbi:MAG: hypothetical protein WCO63_16100, partial [Bacteroidota bacterium]
KGDFVQERNKESAKADGNGGWGMRCHDKDFSPQPIPPSFDSAQDDFSFSPQPIPPSFDSA